MDPRTSHIGFRSQGMASGGYVDVPGGTSANDNLLAMIPVASGERIYVDPMTGKRGGGGGAVTINISSPVMIAGQANRDEIGRTMYQNNQNLARSTSLDNAMTIPAYRLPEHIERGSGLAQASGM